ARSQVGHGRCIGDSRMVRSLHNRSTACQPPWIGAHSCGCSLLLQVKLDQTSNVRCRASLGWLGLILTHRINSLLCRDYGNREPRILGSAEVNCVGDRRSGFARLCPLCFPSCASTGRHDLSGLRNVRKCVLMTAFISLIIAWPVTYWVGAYQNETVYLTTSAAQRLQWISGNMKFTTTPIFIYEDLEELAGGNGNLFNNWVGAIVGQHLAYLGRVDYLVQVQDTPFSNTASRLISALFIKQ